ncbi:MAG: hypothetical protein U5L96_15755 [Owenweeksia sp.]|nr:hypothetical protein [Owenweeksia sp.]
MNLGVAWMIDTLEALGGKNLLNVRAEWRLRDSTLPTSDRDMAELMNLLYPVPSEPLAFPDFDLSGQEGAQPANILIIGDSFFWNYYAFEIRHQLFHPSTRFWYYNNTQRDLYGQETPVSELSAHEAVRNADYVVILATEANLHMFPYSFPEKFLEESTVRE